MTRDPVVPETVTVAGRGALMDAVVAIGTDLDLHAVLRRIVDAACRLVGARYGALGVLDDSGERLVDFVTAGVSDEQRRAIGDLPHGYGLLGLVIETRGPQRVPSIADHPLAHGFPPGHPTMTRFLGAPVRVRDEVFGNLYLTDKESGEDFDADDEASVVALAAVAGVAIDHARLYESSRSAHAWSEAVRDLVLELLGGRSADEVLADVADVVHRLTAARSCLVLRRTGGRTVVVASAGEAVPAPGEVVDDVAPETARVELLGVDEEVGLLVVDGVVVAPGAPEPPLADFAHRLSVGLTAAAAQREQARLERVEDHDRIARDMHDHVIQRLFATGLALQSTARLERDASVRDRLEAAVDEVDAVIRDIRHTIFGLHRDITGAGLRSALGDVVTATAGVLPQAPTLTLEGDLAGLPDDLAADVLAVVREAMSNVARHAGARHVAVRVLVGDEVLVEVVDDGRGMAGTGPRSGLVNLTRRAERRGGRLDAGPAAGGGSALSWRVPR